MLPDKSGYFSEFGGKYVPETLMYALNELDEVYKKIKGSRTFREEFLYYLKQYAGRPTPLYFARELTRKLGGAKIYLKREDLCHTGAHKINNAVGQALLARKLNKKRIIAETGAGQHGVAAATAAALFGMKCAVYMGREDMKRQALNVYRMKLLGAEVIPVESGTRTLKDAINEAIRDWVTNVRTTHYLIGSCVGPHPYPSIVRDFQSVIGEESRKQFLAVQGKLPDYLLACVGGGSNAIGLFHPFYKDKVKFIGVEAAGRGLKTGRHSAPLSKGSVGILHGMRSYLMQDSGGQICETHSVSAGLDYPGVGPEHSYYKKIGRAEYVSATDSQAIDAFRQLCETEGIIPALESAHALAYLKVLAKKTTEKQTVIVCLSGRGDKDLDIVTKKDKY